MNTFVRISHLSVRPGADLVLAAATGFVTMEGGQGATASVADVRDESASGSLMSSSALLLITDGTEHRLAMVRRDDAARPDPGRWQFPAARSRPGELPLITACRALGRELRIEGAVRDWREVRIAVGGPQVDYLAEDAIESFRARYAFVENTFEFYFPMTLRVDSLADVRLSDHDGRAVGLFSPEQVAELAPAGSLTAAARVVFAREFELPSLPAWLPAAGRGRPRPVIAALPRRAAR